MKIIEEMQEHFGTDEPILLSDICTIAPTRLKLCSKSVLNKAHEDGRLVNFSAGVYYIPSATPLGHSLLPARKVIERKYIAWGDEVYGYYSGLTLQNAFGLSDTVPNVPEITTNNETTRLRTVTLGDCTVLLRRSRVAVTGDNQAALVVLELGTSLTGTESLDALSFLAEYVKEKQVEPSLVFELSRAFPKRTWSNLIRSGIFYDTSRR